MSALQIDALWSGINNPTNGKSFGGAIVATFESGTSTPKAVWEDRDKTLPSALGKSQFTLDSNGQAFVFGDGVYEINVYDPTDTGLTNPLSTIEGAEYTVPINEEPETTTYIDVTDYGATGDNVTDDYAAFVLAVAAVGEWDTFLIPPGEYRLSSVVIYENKYRSKIICDGVLKPYGSFDDYLFKITNSVGDPIIPSMGTNVVVDKMTLDCEWKSRGVWIDGVYDSAFDNIHVWRPYGTGIYTPRVQEVSFYKPVIFAGRPRANPDVSGAAAWDSGTTYTNEVVYIEYAAYNAGTTYAGNDVVSSGGILYRSTEAGNVGNAVTTTFWERIPYEYFEATGLASNLDKSPHSTVAAYTTRNSTAGNQFWKPIYPDEAAWEIVSDGASVTIDNMKVWNFISRSNAQETIIRSDNPENSFRNAKIEFYAAQLHAITGVYITAFNASGESWSITSPDIPILFQAASATGLKFFGGQFQTGDQDYCKALLAGTLGKKGDTGSGNASKTFFGNVYFESTVSGNNQVSISVLESVETAGPGNWIEEGINYSNTGTNSIDKVDIDGETVTYQSGSFTVTEGNSTWAVTFDPPMIGLPDISITHTSAAGGDLNGLSFKASSITNTGFTLELLGNWQDTPRTASFTAAGGTDQTFLYTHSYGVLNDLVGVSLAQVDTGADFRIFEFGSTTNTVRIRGPVAPTNDADIKYWGAWRNQSPVNLTFNYIAAIAKE